MALNPPIEALPIQQADRDGHLQRYLSGLPNFESWQDQGEGPAVESNGTRMDVTQDRPISATKAGMDVIQDREAEAAERRNERKTRRREKAAILKPKPIPKPSPPEELDQEWWDNYRAQKQGLLLSNVLQNKNVEMEVEKAEMIMEKKENRRLQKQSRIPNSKGRGRGKGKGIPGIEIIEGYKPMTTALGPRMTMKPETKKGMFANGKSSKPGVINLLESTKASNPRVSSSQSTPGRLTMESPERDWRDQWRRKSSQPHAQPHTREINDKLPDPGYTNSTSWRSTLQSSDGPSKPSRHSLYGGSIAGHLIPRSVRSNGQEDVVGGYMYRYPSLGPLESRRSSEEEEEGLRYSNDPVYQYPSYPIPHDPQSPYTSNHPHHAQEYHPHLQESRFNEGRNIYMHQSQFPQDPRVRQNRNQVYQENNPYPQAYSPLPHHFLHPHSLPFSSPYLHPNPHGDEPRTPIFQDRRNINTDLGMNIPPPFSTPGPSRLPNEARLPQFHPHGEQRDSFGRMARLGQDQEHYQSRPDEICHEGGMEGFWKFRRPVSNEIEQDSHGMGMDIDQAPIFPQYDPQHHHPALPYNEPHHQFAPEHHSHDPVIHFRHQHHLHSHTTSPPQAYFSPRIQHQPEYHGSERRYDASTPNLTYDQYNHPGPISGNLKEEGAGGDKEEEIEKFGTSKEEWKLLWSDRKAFR